MGLHLKILKMGPELFAWRYTESVADQTDHFVDVFVREAMTLWRPYDARKYTADAIFVYWNPV